jgi:predicted permease
VTALRVLISRIRALLERRRRDLELQEEIQIHLDRLAGEHLRRGLTPDQARAAARREFGGVDQIKETYRDQRGLRVVESIWRDLRYAARRLRQSPGFTLVVVLSLSLGVGVNTAIFSVLNAVMLRSLPVATPNELFIVREAHATVGQRFSYPMFEQLRRGVPASSGLAAMSRVARVFGTVDGDRQSQTINVQLVSGEYFSVLGLVPNLGRTLNRDDSLSVGKGQVAVISHGFWLRRFGAAATAIGRGLILNGAPVTIVGVAPPGFAGVWLESPADVWIPLTLQHEVHYAQNFSDDNADADQPWLPQVGIRWLDVIGRARPGDQHTVAAVKTAYQQAIGREAEVMSDPERRALLLRKRVAIEPFDRGLSNLRGRFAAPLVTLLCMAVLILLIACANTANLLLARAASRQREIAVRLSIGASRGRVVQQLLTEGVLIVAIAAVVGLLGARWAADLLVASALGTSTAAPPFPVGLDLRVLGFAAFTSLVTVLLFGLAPAFRGARINMAMALKASAAGIRGAARLRSQKLLVAVQIALSLLLIVGAGLFVRSLQNLSHVELGFDREHVVSVWINPHAAGFPAARLPGLYRSLIERLEAVPGVHSAAVAVCGLANGCSSTSDIHVEGYNQRAGEAVRVQVNQVGPRYFATVGMRLLAGRDFDGRDSATSPKVGVNRAVVQRYFTDRDAIGRRFGYGRADTEIIGVVEDARVNRVQDSAPPMAYFPLTQRFVDAGAIEVRAVGDPRALVDEVRKTVNDVDASLPIERVTTLSEQVNRNVNQERLVAGLASLFGTLALGLACFGLFGVMSYAVTRRSTEFGVRLALGARPASVLWMVFRESLALVLLGLAVGLPAVFVESRLLSGLLFGLPSTDSATVAGATSVLVMCAALACLLPAWRASRADPLVALRCE